MTLTKPPFLSTAAGCCESEWANELRGAIAEHPEHQHQGTACFGAAVLLERRTGGISWGRLPFRPASNSVFSTAGYAGLHAFLAPLLTSILCSDHADDVCFSQYFMHCLDHG